MRIIHGFLIICLCLCTLTLTACEEQKDSRKIDGLSFVDNEGPAPADITIYLEKLPNDYRNVLDEIEIRTKGILNINLDFKQFDVHEDARIEALKSGDCDAMVFYSGVFAYYDDLGYLADLGELFPKYAPNYYARFTEDDLKYAYSPKSQNLVAIPHFMPASDRPCVVVRRDIMTKYNIPPINTFEDLEVYLDAVRKNEPQLVPMSGNISLPNFFKGAYGYAAYGPELVYRWDDPKIKLRRWEETTGFAEMVETIKRWQEKRYIQITFDNPVKQLINGKVSCAFMIAKADILSMISSSEEAFDIYPLYKEQTYSKIPMTLFSISITKKCKNPERVVQLIEWVHASQENYDLFMYGIKGKNYELAGEQIDQKTGENNYETGEALAAFMDIEYVRSPKSLNYDFKEFYITATDTNTKYAPLDSFKNISDSREESKFMNDTSSKRVGYFWKIFDSLRNCSFDVNITNVRQDMDDAGSRYVSMLQNRIDKWLKERNTQK